MSTSTSKFGPVKITETVLRDAHQSLLATRMRIGQMLPQLEALDNIGYNALEAWGGATYDSCLRFLNEDPWERLDTLKAHLKTPIQMLLRGQNLLGYNHYSDDVVRAFVKKASEHGVGVFRIFDALNDVTNLRTAIDAALNCPEKPHVQGCLVYTISPYHTNQTFVDLALELKKMGVHSICIKDMSGLLKPYVAEDLVKKLKEQVGLPVELHTHYTSGFGSMTYLKAIEAGVDIIDCALSPLANDTSQPCTETMVAALEGLDRDTGLDRQAMEPIAKHFLGVKKEIMKEFNLPGYFDVNPKVLDFQIPGGMLSNMVNQLKEMGAADKYQELLDEMPRVREDLGFPPLVTPSSQIVGTMATMNVIMQANGKERYTMVPNEVRDLARGKFGHTPKPVKPEVLAAMKIKPEDMITDCAIEDAKAPKMADFRKELAGISADQRLAGIKSQLESVDDDIYAQVREAQVNKLMDAIPEEDVLSYALFPQVALEFFKKNGRM